MVTGQRLGTAAANLDQAMGGVLNERLCIELAELMTPRSTDSWPPAVAEPTPGAGR